MDNNADIIDIQADVIDRVEELEAEQPLQDDDELAELDALKELLGELEGNGGDVQWDGSWYPQALINDDHFQDYAQELAEDCGMVNSEASWPNNCIDWERAAQELQTDYTTVEIDGVTFWYR